jgi:hypothetical protein
MGASAADRSDDGGEDSGNGDSGDDNACYDSPDRHKSSNDTDGASSYLDQEATNHGVPCKTGAFVAADDDYTSSDASVAVNTFRCTKKQKPKATSFRESVFNVACMWGISLMEAAELYKNVEEQQSTPTTAVTFAPTAPELALCIDLLVPQIAGIVEESPESAFPQL